MLTTFQTTGFFCSQSISVQPSNLSGGDAPASRPSFGAVQQMTNEFVDMVMRGEAQWVIKHENSKKSHSMLDKFPRHP